MTSPETFSKTIDRTLSAQDSKQNIPFAFQVPNGTTQLTFHFSYTPKKVGEFSNLLTLTVFDPTGWRGEGHRHDDPSEIVISEGHASPGFLPGPVTPGEWMVFVNTHMVLPDEPCRMNLTIHGLTHAGQASLQRAAPGQTSSRGPGWYRGDLHAHSLHSDAVWDVSSLVADARRRGLDFVTLSDHNTISGLAELEAARADDLLTIAGMELTTFWGHALVLGLHEWVDWRSAAAQVGQPGERGMEAICREVTERGGLFIIAHPMAQGDPYCTGCDWRYPSVLPGPARVVEVWNSDWSSESNNENGLRLVFGWLNQGYRLALTAGTDNHGRGEMHYGFNNVYANDLTEKGILNAVRAGRLYISAGPRLELTAATTQEHAAMGAVLNAGNGTNIQIITMWEGCPPGARLEWVVDGEAREQFSVQDEGSRTWQLPGGSAHWSLAALRDPAGRMLALTNPIYFDGRS